MAEVRSVQDTASFGGTGITPIMPYHESGDLLIAIACKGNSTGGDYTCTAGWTTLGAPYKHTGCTLGAFYKVASSSSEAAPTLSTTQSAYTVALVIAIKNPNGVNASAVSTALTTTNQTQPFTTTENDCLVLSILAVTSASSSRPYFPAIDPGSGYSVEAFASGYGPSIAVYSKYQRTAGAVPQVGIWRHASSPLYVEQISVAIRDTGGAIDAYPDSTSDISVLEYFRSSTAADNPVISTITATGVLSPIEGVVLSNSTGLSAVTSSTIPARVVDTAVQMQVAFPTSPQAVSSTLTNSVDVTGDVIVGRANMSSRIAAANCGTIAQRGLSFAIGEGSNYRAYTINATDAEDLKTLGASLFVVDPSTGGYASNGTPNQAAITKLQFSTRLLSSLLSFYLHLSTIYRVGKVVIAGGSATNPINFDKFVKRACNAFISPLMEVSGQSGMLYAPVCIGGGDPVYFMLDAFALQFPTSSSTNPRLTRCHVTDGKLGISVNAKAGDVVKLTNGVISSGTPIHFNFLSTTSATAAYDFTGLTLVNGIVTLRDVTTFRAMTFVECAITHNGADIDGCTLNGSTITTADPSNITDCTFISDGAVIPEQTAHYIIDIGTNAPVGNVTHVPSTTSVAMIDTDGVDNGADVIVTSGTLITSGVNTDNYFDNLISQDGRSTGTTITVEFSGLPANMVFDVNILGSRIGNNAGNGYWAKYTVETSETTDVGVSDASDNVTPITLTATVGSDGLLTITVIRDPDHPSSGNACINGIELVGSIPAVYRVGGGHAITLTATGTYTLSDLTFTGYGANGTTDAAIYNNSGGAVTLNIAGGSTPTIRNGASASTTIQSGATIVVEGLATGSRVIATLISDGSVLHNGLESSGSVSFTVSAAGAIKIEARKASAAPYYRPWATQLTPISGQTNTVTALQELDQ